MADNDDTSKSQNEFDSLDDEFEFDLFDESEGDAADESGDAELEEFPDLEEDLDEQSLRSTEKEVDPSTLHDDLHDDLTDDLEEGLFEISDEEVQEEFAALEREESQEDELANDIADELDALDDSFEEQETEDDADAAAELEASLADAVESTADELKKTNFEYDPDTSDDLDFELTREEFGTPDQNLSKSAKETSSQKKIPEKNTSTASGSMPAVLAALASLPPKLVVAATAAVLLPLVFFAVLGLNSGDSDADTEVPIATFTDEPAGTGISAQEQPNAPERPEPEPAARTVLPDSPSESDVAAQTPEPEVAIQNETLGPDQTNPDLENLIAQTQAEPSAQTDISEQPESPAEIAQGQQPETTQAEPQQEAPTTMPEETNEQSGEALAATEPSEPSLADEVEAIQAESADTVAQELVSTEVAEPVTTISEEPEATQAASARVATPMASGRDYHIVVASFPTNADAQAHAERISDAEITAYVIAPFGSSSNYRVAVASYTSMAEARQNIPGLRNVYGEGIWPLRYPPSGSVGVPVLAARSGEVFIIVASYPNEGLAREHAESLLSAGERPAIISPYAPSNRYRVAVARFNSLESAQEALGNYRQRYGDDSWLLRY